MINSIPFCNKSNIVNFKSSLVKPPFSAHAEKIENTLNNLFGVNLDEFISVCKARDFYNTHGMTRQEYDNDDSRFESPSI